MCGAGSKEGSKGDRLMDVIRGMSGKTAAPAVGTGVTSGGYSGPSAARSAGAVYMRRKSGAPLLDSMFGVEQANG